MSGPINAPPGDLKIHFSGTVHSVLFENADQAFYILSMTLDSKDSLAVASKFDLDLGERITVKGHVPGLKVQPGCWFSFEGTWVTHEKYGKQLEILRAPVVRGAWTEIEAFKVLSANGVGVSDLETIRLHATTKQKDLLECLSDQETLAGIEGISKARAEYICKRWVTVRVLFQTVQFLYELGLPKAKIKQIWETFGDQAETVLSTNPWDLVKINGISFKQADSVARRLGLSLDCPQRLEGVIHFVVGSQARLGHLFLTPGELVLGVQQEAPGSEGQVILESLVSSIKNGKVILDRETSPGITAVYQPGFYNLESKSAELLHKRVLAAQENLDDPKSSYIRGLGNIGKESRTVSDLLIGGEGTLRDLALAAIRDWSLSNSFQLGPDQVLGVANALSEPVSILTGLPGTGKTSSLRAAVRILQEAEVSILLVAPTGIAAKRLESLTLSQASTIHRAFRAKGSSDEQRDSTYEGITGGASEAPDRGLLAEEWGFSPENPHPAQVVLIDETSMVDQELLYRVLSCTSPTCRIVVVGDAAQLPSVGPGKVLRDLVSSGVFPVTSLTQIFRQEDTSGIIQAAHDIHAGTVPVGDKDFVFIDTSSEEAALSVLIQLTHKLYLKQQSSESRISFQVLSPRHGGKLGVTALNTRLRELINPRRAGLREMQVGNIQVREGDRVMVTKNNYDMGVFNGDMGKIVQIDRKDRKIKVKIHGTVLSYVVFPFKEVASHLRLAYACTIHKSQGSEYDVVILPLVNSFSFQLQRNLLYTAVTRAKKRVFLIGDRAALSRAVTNNREQARNTLFDRRLVNLFDPPF